MFDCEPLVTIDAIHHRIKAAREKASFFVTQRRKDVELYQVLADCLAICEGVSKSGTLDELKRRFIAECKQPGRRKYLESNADVFLVVGRFVFEKDGDSDRRACCWRYTATMREAEKRGIHSSKLVEWMRENGGINSLFRARSVEARSTQTKTLHLNQSITLQKGRKTTITIEMKPNGFCDVLSAHPGRDP